MKMEKGIYIVFAVVAAQLLWLGWNYTDRTRELENAPVVRLECTDYDPRDLFRGDYVVLNTRQIAPLEIAGKSIHWDEEFCKSINTHATWVGNEHKEFLVINPLSPRPQQMEDSLKLRYYYGDHAAVFWRMGEDGVHHPVRVEKAGSPADVAAEGEVRSLCLVSVQSNTRMQDANTAVQQTVLAISFDASGHGTIRFYVAEKTGDLARIWTREMGEKRDEFPGHRIRRTVDMAIRQHASAVPRMLYLNGVPYPEAVEQIRNRTFKWLPENSK